MTARNAAIKMLNSMIASNEAEIVEMRKALAEHNRGRSIVSHAWVVRMPGDLFPKFSTSRNPDGKGHIVSTSGFDKPHKVSRWTEEDAKSLAAGCVNGGGERGTAMHWADAVNERITSMEEVNDFSRECIAKQQG